MTARAKAVYNPAYDTVGISVSPYPGSVFTWPSPELVIVANGEAPSSDAEIKVTEDVARALYEALGRYFGGDIVDASRLRKDYDAERGRVDKFIEALTKRALTGGGVQ